MSNSCGGLERKTAICGLCGKSCLMNAYMKNGRLIKVEGNRSLPHASGHLCSKGAAYRQYLYHPDRLLYPMRRVGVRGEGKFERISWDEALNEISQRLLKSRCEHGAEQTVFFAGHPKWFRPQLAELADKFGTPNYGSESSTCAYSVRMACRSCFGTDVSMIRPDFVHCRTLVIWGVNRAYSDSVSGTVSFLRAVESGKNIIVIDPRITPEAQRATLHLRPFPGTDGALAMAIANVMISEELYDREFVEQYTIGFEEYKQHVQSFSPERAEKICGVPAPDIERAARMMCIERPTSMQLSASPVVHNVNGFHNCRAVLLLNALTGCYGVKGGVMSPIASKATLKGTFAGPAADRRQAERDLSHSLYPAWAALLPSEAQLSRLAEFIGGGGDYPVRNLVGFGLNHHMWPRPDLLEKAFDQLKLLVNVDLFMTDTCRYCDILLPASVSLEREQIEILGGDTVYYQPRVVDTSGEAKSDIEIIFSLARCLGFGIGSPEMSSHDDYLRMMLEPTGLSLDELRAAPGGLLKSRQKSMEKSTEEIRSVKTPSGKIEFISTTLTQCGVSPLPEWRDYRKELPMEEYPFILATGTRLPQLFHSRTYRMPWLAELEKIDKVEIHPKDASVLGIAQGEPVRLSTPFGSVELWADLRGECLPGVVNVYHGSESKDINYLLDAGYLDPVSGFPGFKSYCCKIERLGDAQ